MQLLVKRGQSDGTLGRVTFDLWAKFEVTEEEQALLAKYNARNAILSEGNPWRDLRRGLVPRARVALSSPVAARGGPSVTDELIPLLIPR